jgi:hypothetical protein
VSCSACSWWGGGGTVGPVVLTTLIVTFTVTVGLALAVLYSVAGPPLRARGSRFIATVDAVLHRLATAVRERVAAHREAATRDEPETAHSH